MGNPYRTRPDAPLPARGAEGRLGAATLVFGLFCALFGQALAGPGAALIATIAGVFLILAPAATERTSSR